MPIDEGEDTTDIQVEIDVVDPDSGLRPLPADAEPDSMEVMTEIRGRLPADLEPLTAEPRTAPKLVSPGERRRADTDNTIEPRTAPRLVSPGHHRQSDADAEHTLEPQTAPAGLASPAEEDPSTLEPHMSVRSIDNPALEKMREAFKEDETETGRSIATALEQAARESYVAWEEVERPHGPVAGAVPRTIKKRKHTFIGIAPPPETDEGPSGADVIDVSIATVKVAPTENVALQEETRARDTIAEMTEKRKPVLLMTPVDPIMPSREIVQPRPAAGAAPATEPLPTLDTREEEDEEEAPRTEKISKETRAAGIAEAERRSSGRMRRETERFPKPSPLEPSHFGLAETQPAFGPEPPRSDRWNAAAAQAPPPQPPSSARLAEDYPSVRRIDPALVPPMASSRHPSESAPVIDARTRGRRSAAIMMALAFVLAGGGASAFIVWQTRRPKADVAPASSVASSGAASASPVASGSADPPPPADSVASAAPTDKPPTGRNPRIRRPPRTPKTPPKH